METKIKNIKKFMPKHQQKMVYQSEELQGILVRLGLEITKIPTHQTITEEMEKEKGSFKDAYIVYAHFFYAGCDWYILEWNKETELVYCYAILNGDVEMSELGYEYLANLTEDGRIELDFYWTPCSLAQALYEKDSSFFPKPNL